MACGFYLSSCFLSLSWRLMAKFLLLPRVLSVWKSCLSLLPRYWLFNFIPFTIIYFHTVCKYLTICGQYFFEISLLSWVTLRPLLSPLKGRKVFTTPCPCPLWVPFPNSAALSSQEFLFLSLIMQEEWHCRGQIPPFPCERWIGEHRDYRIKWPVGLAMKVSKAIGGKDGGRGAVGRLRKVVNWCLE